MNRNKLAKAGRESIEPRSTQTKTLRDEFAMAALQGLLISSDLSIEENCHLAYMYADKMLKERIK